MKLHKYFFIFLLLASQSALAQTGFSYKRSIAGVDQEGWYSILLPPEMFSTLNDSFGDLRLYAVTNTDSVEIPYILKTFVDQASESTLKLPAVNKSFRNGILFLTFELPPTQKVNYLDLKFEQSNFYGFVTIEGSSDGYQWFEISSNQRIVSIKNNVDDYLLSTVNFPVTDYRFLRVAVRSDKRLTFAQATFQYNVIKHGEFENIPLRWSARTEKKDRSTIVDIRLGHYVPVNTLNVTIDSAVNYYRAARVEYVTDSAKTEKGWIKHYSTIENGYVTSFKNNQFHFNGKLTKEIRLTISDFDNAPLTIQRISADRPVVKIISFLKPAEMVMLYGSENVHAPVYDLAYFENKIPDSVSVAVLSTEETLGKPEKKGAPLFENKVWLWSIMGLMIGGLGFFTIKMMRVKG